MLDDMRILLVEDNSAVRHDLLVILNFLSENALALDFSEWRLFSEGVRQQATDVGVVILGHSIKGNDLPVELKTVRDRFGTTPVITMGDDYPDPSADRDSSLRQRVIAKLKLPLEYNCLVDALHRAQRYREALALVEKSPEKRPVHLFRSLVGTSRHIQAVRAMMSQVADKDVTVLIAGESGTGKEVVARNLHYHSPRRDKPFVPVNCGAIPAELLESELFGHEKGAFTGAINSRAGRFEMAEGGTLFLDEIGDMPLHMQVKILRVLQEKSFERVGGNKTFQTDVRIIAATHRNLEAMIEKGEFREDLYYRLHVFPIEMPSLKERAEDIPLLINELVSRMESEKRGSIRFNSAAILSLCRHSWPGNVRELANLVERMAIMHPYGVIGVQDLPAKYCHVAVEEDFPLGETTELSSGPSVVSMSDRVLLPESGIDLKEYINGLEQSLIQQALDDSGGIVARAAERLAMRRTTLVEKMRKYGMQR
ncbi:MAG: sigma-54 dependent transcriptional regulator [Cellvibrionaceae bacterium]|nr:sigma-54 dependent transcriptional regulator [Cellvibrionaceae bacterium]